MGGISCRFLPHIRVGGPLTSLRGISADLAAALLTVFQVGIEYS
jgi:hypothetical protein